MKPIKTTLAALSILCANALGQTSNTSPTADYLLDLSWKDVKFTNVMALAENAAVEVRGIDPASSASSLWYYLSARDGTALAITTNVVASTNANAVIGYLNLATTNLQAQFAGANPIAEKNFVFSVWDTARDVLLASALVGVKNNPLANGLISGWTNLPASLTNEFSASVLAALDAAWNAQFVASNAYALAYGIATTNEPLWTAASNSVLYVGDIAETAYGTETNTAYRGDWGASVSNLAAQAAGWGDHAAAGYLTAESDTAALAAVAGVESNVTALAETVGGITAESLGALTAETDPAWTAASGSVVYATTPGYTAAVEQAASAYGWGDHAAAGYLTGFTETDGVFTASAAYGITSESIGEWDAAYGWAQTNYLPLAGGKMTPGAKINMSGGDITNASEIHVEHIYEKSDPYNIAIDIQVKELVGDWHIDKSLTYLSAATNSFLRPDGGTNTISFDGSGSMIVAVDGTAAMTISTNGKVGIGTGIINDAAVSNLTLGGVTRTNWPQGTILGATINEPNTVATNDGILAFTVTADGSGWTNLSITGTGNAITGATAAADTLTLQRGEIESGGSGFPLTNNGDLATFSLTNGTFAGTHTGDGSGLTNLPPAGEAWSGYPATQNVDIAQFNLTNGLTVQATNGQFKTLAVSGGNTTLGALTAGNTTIQGNLTVTGTTYNITTVNISTNYYVGVSTTYVDEVRYSTNYTYTYVYTNIVSTNTVNTYVDVGGTWDASNSAWAAFPHFVDTASGNLVGIGTWDFTGATLIGLPAQGVTNIGSSMTGNGLETALDVDWGTATTTAMTNIDWASFDGGITNIGDGLTGDGLANALEVERWADVEEMLENQTNVVSVAGGPSAYTVGRFPVWDGNTWVQSEYVPASSTGAVSSVNLMVGHIAVAGFGVTSVSTDTNTSTITIGTSTNEVRAIRDEAFRPYTTLSLSGGTALVTRTSGRWLMIAATNVAVTLAVDAASYTNALEAIQHNVMWIRGTNETYAIVTNNIANSAYIDCPVSTTNHFLLEKRPGWPRFQIWQDFR